jgi:hypothetical protein
VTARRRGGLVVKGVYRQLQSFMRVHEGCGPNAVAVAAVPPPGSEGYNLSACCDCGATFERWVSAEDARHDMIFTTLLVSWN